MARRVATLGCCMGLAACEAIPPNLRAEVLARYPRLSLAEEFIAAFIQVQRRQCLTNIAAILEEAGSVLNKIVSVTVILADEADFLRESTDCRLVDLTVLIDVAVPERHRRLAAREHAPFLQLWHAVGEDATIAPRAARERQSLPVQMSIWDDAERLFSEPANEAGHEM